MTKQLTPKQAEMLLSVECLWALCRHAVLLPINKGRNSRNRPSVRPFTNFLYSISLDMHDTDIPSCRVTASAHIGLSVYIDLATRFTSAQNARCYRTVAREAAPSHQAEV